MLFNLPIYLFINIYFSNCYTFDDDQITDFPTISTMCDALKNKIVEVIKLIIYSSHHFCLTLLLVIYHRHNECYGEKYRADGSNCKFKEGCLYR